MKKIPSFTIDHNRLLRGVYASRRDVTPSGDVITTFDVRMTEPNRQPALSPKRSTLSSILRPHISAIIPNGRTASSTGDRWVAAPATI